MASIQAKAILAQLATDWGVHVAAQPVCCGHHAPLDFLSGWVFDRPPISLTHGPRGGGKSFLRSLATHIDSIRYHHHKTKILGGSLAQSEQVYNALGDFDRADKEAHWFHSYTRTKAVYRETGSEVSILSASPTSVRGPHIPTLCLDEVDEIDSEVRESAIGMSMEVGGVQGSIAMTSTWHRVAGPMSDLIAQGDAGAFPVYRFCAFEVLEHCSEERSGPNLEHCPECPLKTWCHDEGIAEAGSPKAKRSDGHYAITSLIQKAMAVSARVFEADYLCRGPKAAGLWFPSFNRATHVGDDAEYDPALPVYLAVDCGTSRYTGAVLFQLRERPDGSHLCTVFGDYLGVDLVSEVNARAIQEIARQRCNGRLDRVRLDPASRARTSVGPVVYGEYQRVFGSLVEAWPLRSVRDSLDLLDSFIRPASGPVCLRIHPRCEDTIRAIESFRRAKRRGIFIDEPEPEDHPHEDLVDALKGGLGDVLPDGRRPAPKLTRISPTRVF